MATANGDNDKSLEITCATRIVPGKFGTGGLLIFVTFPSFRGRHRGEAFVVKIAASLPSLNLFPAVKEPPPLFEAKTSSGQSDLFNSPLPIKNDPLS